MKTTTTYPACAIDGCETVAKTYGLCNTHYMNRYRTQQRQIEKELLDVVAKNRAPASLFLCDECDESADVWWAVGGDIDAAIVLCSAHVESKIESMRLDIRRLELRQP